MSVNPRLDPVSRWRHSGTCCEHRATQKSSVRLVVNPATGDGRGLELGRALLARLQARGHDVLATVAADLSATRRALEQSRKDFGTLVCIGGDRTLDELAPVALERDAVLLPVPAGFGNVFARALGHRADVDSVLATLERGEARWVDVGVTADARDPFFLANHGFGFLHDVQEAVERSGAVPRSRLLRYLAYLRAAVRAVGIGPLPALRVEADGDVLVEDAALVVVANVPTYPGTLLLTPEATPFDGILDVSFVERTTKLGVIARLMATLIGRGRWTRTLGRRAKHVRVQRNGDATEHVEVQPHALAVLMPPLA